jgi:tetratricopeptide (TPR) repeat protein
MMRQATVVIVIALARMGLPSTAQQLATEPDRRDALQYYRVGQELMSGEQFEKAAEQFSKAIRKDRLLTLAHYGLGQAYMGLRRYASAVKAYSDCLEAFKTLHGLQQAHRFDVERRRDDEIRELKENVRSLTQAGRALRATQAEARVRDLERQKTSLEAAFQPPAEVSLALGSAFFRDGHSDQAEIHWLAAINSNPKLGEAHNNLAVVYLQTDRLDEADQQLKLAEKFGFRVNPQLKQDVKKRRDQNR